MSVGVCTGEGLLESCSFELEVDFDHSFLCVDVHIERFVVVELKVS